VSSPNAKEHHSGWDRVRIGFHRRASHHHRIDVLVRALAPHVTAGGTLLDLGCGDLRVAEGLRRERGLARCVGADIWQPRVTPPAGLEYRQIESGAALPWDDGAFDVVTLVDTLHHSTDAEGLLREALRVGRRVLVKDHFEYGRASPTLLQVLDYLGNHAYGVPIPGRYFTRASFDRLVHDVAPG
jgi:SAM-dependent methyltransferase